MWEGNVGPGRTMLDPKLDIVFWMLFGAEQNRTLLVSLLNAVLAPAAPIESVEVLHAQPERLAVDDKSIALDVRVRLETGEQVDVEMQSQRRLALRERALYYWARLYAGQLVRGTSYGALRRCAVILIANFAELPTSQFHSRFRVRGEHDPEPLTDHLELHLVELPKLRGALDRNQEPILAAWGKFLVAATDEDLEALAMQYPVLKQAKDALEHLSADPEARLRAEQREMALISYELDLGKAHSEGRAQGKAELLLEQLIAKFGEQPAAVHERLAAATQSDLSRWAKRVLTAATLGQVFDA